jgi:hypothetical protein
MRAEVSIPDFILAERLFMQAAADRRTASNPMATSFLLAGLGLVLFAALRLILFSSCRSSSPVMAKAFS